MISMLGATIHRPPEPQCNCGGHAALIRQCPLHEPRISAMEARGVKFICEPIRPWMTREIKP